MDKTDGKLISELNNAYLKRIKSLSNRMEISNSETMKDTYARALVMSKLCYQTFGDLLNIILDIFKKSVKEAETEKKFYNELSKGSKNFDKLKKETLQIEDEFERLARINDATLDYIILMSQAKNHAARETSRQIDVDLATVTLRSATTTLKEMYSDEDMKNIKGKVIKLLEYLSGKLPGFSEVYTADQIHRYDEIKAKNMDEYVENFEAYDHWCYTWCLLIEKLADYWSSGNEMAQRSMNYHVEKIDKRLKEMENHEKSKDSVEGQVKTD